MPNGRIRQIALAAALVACSLTVFASSAQASAVKSVSFSDSYTFKSRPLGICADFTVSGNISYTDVRISDGKGGVFYDWQNQKLNSPKLTASIHKYAGGSCTGAATVSRISLGQFWTGYSCSFNPTLSVSFPWGVSFGGWPSCGNRNRAAHTTSYGSGGSYTQDNTGSPTRFGGFDGSPKDLPCYGVIVSATAYEGNSSDSFTSNSREVCVPV